MPKVVLRETDLRAIEYAAQEASKLTPQDKKELKALKGHLAQLQGIVGRYNAASLPKAKAELPYGTLVGAAQEHFPGRLITPMGAIVGQVVRRVGALGLNLEQWNTVCARAAKLWRGPVRLESLARQADKLLSDVEDVGKAEIPALEEWSKIGE